MRYCKNGYISALMRFDYKYQIHLQYFHMGLIVEFYNAIEKKSKLVAIPSIGSLQPCFC